MNLACPAATSFLAICLANYRTCCVQRIKNDDDDDLKKDTENYVHIMTCISDKNGKRVWEVKKREKAEEGTLAIKTALSV